jgi:hypothetical protein
MHEPERQHRDLRVGLPAEQRLERAEIVQRLVDDGETDHRVHEIRIHVDMGEHARQQRHAVTDAEQRDVQRHVAEAIEKEDDAENEQEMVVARHHVLGAEIQEREHLHALVLCDELGILAGNAVRLGDEPAANGKDEQQQCCDTSVHGTHT